MTPKIFNILGSITRDSFIDPKNVVSNTLRFIFSIGISVSISKIVQEYPKMFQLCKAMNLPHPKVQRNLC